MKPNTWTATVAVVACAGAVAVCDAIPADAAGWPQFIETSDPKPPKPPVVVVDPTKDGAALQGTGKVNGRLDGVRRPPKKTRPPSSRSPRKHNADHARQLTNPLKHDDLRINIGICGHIGDAPGLDRCLPALDEPDEQAQPNRPEARPSGVVVVRIPRPEDVRWDQVLSAVKEVAFPQLGVKVQPAGRTLVNLETIVYTDQSKVSTQTVTLLGFPVVVEATPVSYTWSFGDGTSVTTTTPGRPYPAKDITHKYMKKGGVSLTLTTHYAARFDVAGTGWQYIDGTVPITGPATGLQVREAVPVLVEPGR